MTKRVEKLLTIISGIGLFSLILYVVLRLIPGFGNAAEFDDLLYDSLWKVMPFLIIIFLILITMLVYPVRKQSQTAQRETEPSPPKETATATERTLSRVSRRKAEQKLEQGDSLFEIPDDETAEPESIPENEPSESEAANTKDKSKKPKNLSDELDSVFTPTLTGDAPSVNRRREESPKPAEPVKNGEPLPKPASNSFFSSIEAFETVAKPPETKKSEKRHHAAEASKKGVLSSLPITRTRKEEKQAAVRVEEIEDSFPQRFKQEFEASAEHGYEITLAFIRLRFKDKTKREEPLPKYEKLIRMFLKDTAYIYPYKSDQIENSYACIIPFANYKETEAELLALYRYLRDTLRNDELIFSSGFSSSYLRKFESTVLLNEAESSLKKALKRRSFSLIGFEPDVDLFESHL